MSPEAGQIWPVSVPRQPRYNRKMPPDWNAGLYDASHAFVWEFGRDLLALLAPQPGEHILDAGCGSGHLTAEIAQSGAQVLGVDQSAAMVAQARENFPLLPFEILDVRALPFRDAFDAIFSNAVLHWVQPPEPAAAAMARALKPGGRLVCEFGGRGNIRILVEGACHALHQLGVHQPERFNPWYYPSVAEYGTTGPWTDVFAFALIVVELLAGREALEGEIVGNLAVQSCDPHARPTPRALGAIVGDEVEQVLARALAVSPEDRFLNARDLWDALLAALVAQDGADIQITWDAAEPGADDALAEVEGLVGSDRLSPTSLLASSVPLALTQCS